MSKSKGNKRQNAEQKSGSTETAAADKEKKPFKMPIAWMKPDAPPENPLQHALLGMTWIFVFVYAKFMQAAGFDIWFILVTQVLNVFVFSVGPL